MDSDSFWQKVRELGFWVVVAICLVFLWMLSIKTLMAQTVPLVRAAHNSFVSYYDIERHNPAMVVYPLEFAHFAGNAKVGTRHFKMDTQLPRPRVKDSDYKNSGYVRGHLCSAGDRDSNKSWLKETYLTSNMVPMTMVCNSGAFKAVEDSCRFLASRGHKLLIGRIPLYYTWSGSRTIVLRASVSISIPDAFYCVANCRECDLRYTQLIRQDGINPLDTVLQFRNDSRVGMLLANIFGLWSREEYETITH